MLFRLASSFMSGAGYRVLFLPRSKSCRAKGGNTNGNGFALFRVFNRGIRLVYVRKIVFKGRLMSRIVRCAVLVAFITIKSSAATIIWDAVGVDESWPVYDDNGRISHYRFRFYSVNSGDGFSEYLGSICSMIPKALEMIVAVESVDIASGKYLGHFNEGELIDKDSVRDSEHFMFTNWTGEKGDDIVVPRNGSFIFGFEIDDNFAYDPVTGERDKLYGWAIFQIDGTSVSVTSSALAVGTDGIYAGTGIIIPRQVPEPSISVLAIIGIVALMLKREVKSKP